MSAKNQDLVIKRGNTVELKFTVRRKTDRSLVDLSTATVEWWAAPKVTSVPGEAFTQKSSANGTIQINGSICTVVILPTDFDDAPTNENYHEARVVIPGSGTYTVFSGRLYLEPTLID